MLNNIFMVSLLGFIVSCSVHPNYPSSDNHNHSVPVVPSSKYPSSNNDYYRDRDSRYRDPRYYDRYPNRNRPTKRLAPTSPPTRSNGKPIYSVPHDQKSRPTKRVSPATGFRNNKQKYLKEPSPPKRFKNNQKRYLKQPSSNYMPRIPSSKGYVTRGYASQYQLSEHGMKTTSGQIYDMYGMTAAHINLPLMSTVVVKNLRTKRSVIVTINDRLHQGLIKLSYMAANKLKLSKKSSQLLEIRGL
ncbi:septal ring lytic transglycosylase RlpA family protein [Thiotrichales bacterium HSG1]|nr:septal ring lytic transglycosylase RlpA family protein [Thiotrichales bacterium HSG1]